MTKRFGQVKRYGLEGGETLLVALEQLLKLSAQSKKVFDINL